MKTLNKLTIILFLMCTLINYAQSENEKEEEATETSIKNKEKKNSSEEIVTKIIRIKGANGEEKVIKQQQVITKKSGIEFNPEDQDQTDQTAIYTPEKVSVKNMGTTSNEKIYSSIADGTGYIITLIDEKGEKTSKAKPLSNGYYLVNNGARDNCLGHFDENKNLILETYDSENDNIATISYKLKAE